MHSNNIGTKLIRKNLIFLAKSPVIPLKKLQRFSRRKANEKFLNSEQDRDETPCFLLEVVSKFTL